MERLTLKIKRQLAFLMVGILFFNCVPMLDLLVYAQEDVSTTVLSDSASDGDESGDGSVSGGDSVSDGDDISDRDINSTPPTVTNVIYTGLSRVEDGQGEVVDITEDSVIDETMCALQEEK